MAKQDLTTIYEGADLSGATNNVLYLPIVSDATLEKVSVRTDAAQSGAAVFEVRKNGSVITGLSALTIPNGAKIGAVSGLAAALVDGDEIVLNLLSGSSSAPVTLSLGTDDGSSAGGGGGAADYDAIIWTKVGFSKIEGTRLVKTGGTYGGASSYQKIGANGSVRLPPYGLVSISDLVFGLSYADTSTDWTTIDFCFFINSGTGNIDIYEAGADVMSSIGVYNSGRQLEIVRSGTTVTYKLDGVTKRTTTCTSASMVADTSIFNNSTGFELLEIKTA